MKTNIEKLDETTTTLETPFRKNLAALVHHGGHRHWLPSKVIFIRAPHTGQAEVIYRIARRMY
jgi:hypothetical protein